MIIQTQRSTIFKLVLGSFLLLSFGNSYSQQITDSVAPEVGTQLSQKSSVTAKKFIVSAAHPIATKVGYDVLESGGNAIDAMVAVQVSLGLVEPQSSGLGGGAFLVFYNAETKQLTTFDGRETAPLSAPSDLFLDERQSPMAFFDAVVGGRSVGTPGTPKLLWETHLRYGTKPWKDLLEPTIDIAMEGFTVSPRLSQSVVRDEKHLTHDSTAREYFFPNGKAIQPGQTLKNIAYANTLKQLASDGDYFYSKEFSKDLVQKVRNSRNPGHLSVEDFWSYKIVERAPKCMPYRVYEVCGMGPPSSGAISVNQTLGILESFDIKDWGFDSSKYWHYFAEASRLAFADRGAYLADPNFVDIPTGLQEKSYLAERAALISPDQALVSVKPGKPLSKLKPALSPEQESTTHFVIVDAQGNIVSMTSTIENGFGSRLMVNGFLLNNELTDFSFSPTKNDALVANRVEPGKRPRSSMAPTIVFKDDKPFLAIGSPGGSRIIPYVAKTVSAVIDFSMDLQSAIDSPHIINRFGTMDIEADTSAVSKQTELESLGYKTSVRNLNSGLHGVLFSPDRMIGAADPRREGVVMGK